MFIQMSFSYINLNEADVFGKWGAYAPAVTGTRSGPKFTKRNDIGIDAIIYK